MKIEYAQKFCNRSLDIYRILTITENEARPIGCKIGRKAGQRGRNIWKAHKSGTYTYLLLTARLDIDHHPWQIWMNSHRNTFLNRSRMSFSSEMRKCARLTVELTEKLKRQKILWNGYATATISANRAAEIIKQELIYVWLLINSMRYWIPDMRK